MREFVKESALFGVGHAAGDPDDLLPHLRAAILAHRSHHLTLGEIADRASVEKQKVGLFGYLTLSEPPLGEHASHHRAIQLIHLAAIGFDVKSLWFFHISQISYPTLSEFATYVCCIINSLPWKKMEIILLYPPST